ncbi:MAG: hypothetical protein R6U28_04470 [Cyclonatronaceae bacterium]
MYKAAFDADGSAVERQITRRAIKRTSVSTDTPDDDRFLHSWGTGYLRDKPEVERAAGEGASFPLRLTLSASLANRANPG